MKNFKYIFSLIAAFALVTITTITVNAQCAMCTTAVETNAANGGNTADGLNKGIVYLLAAPYIAVAVIGIIWYKKYRRKNVELHMREEKLNLN
ncbi:hypothetical protein [Mucilaginibacter segetis]|uniref:CcmD family protein n=1 Tax=Mucilaginibacter segetis TaxID=2793071 RepID=A0A934UNZ0_9SPHI|nr:hypothetical protein [Mucilaginibacter segetis]MBK0381308.1 hypothetical protein [Mucilaginibacter segetis]